MGGQKGVLILSGDLPAALLLPPLWSHPWFAQAAFPHVSDTGLPYTDICPFTPIINFGSPVTYLFGVWPRASAEGTKVSLLYYKDELRVQTWDRRSASCLSLLSSPPPRRTVGVVWAPQSEWWLSAWVTGSHRGRGAEQRAWWLRGLGTKHGLWVEWSFLGHI